MKNSLSKYQIFDLSQQTVRDLAWSLWGPALLKHAIPYAEENQFPLDLAWLKALDQDSQELTAYLETKNTHLLGTYFEALWQFYFSHHPRFKYAVNNLQVFELPRNKGDIKRTLGEFDALVQDTTRQHYHVELTCKFYLEVDSTATEVLWLGPNCRDRLDIKYDKTHTKQLPLLFTKQGKEAAICAFSSINSAQNYYMPNIAPENFEQVAIWRGHLFTRENWIKQKDLTSKLATLKITQYHGWIVANKNRWLSPIVLEKDQAHILKNTQLIQHTEQYLHEKNSPFMLILLRFDELKQQWLQSEQFFVTPNKWPYGVLSDRAETPLRPCNPPVCIIR